MLIELRQSEHDAGEHESLRRQYLNLHNTVSLKHDASVSEDIVQTGPFDISAVFNIHWRGHFLSSAYDLPSARQNAGQGTSPPARSPESNCVAAAFVCTFKRDYLRVNPLPGAETVTTKIGARIDGQNNIYPHFELKMRSPNEFRKASKPA